MTDLPTYIYNRAFDAPLPKVWTTWTDPKLLAIWYGPGVETIIHEFDLRAGGRWLNEMKWGETSDFSRMDFLEVLPQEKLVWHHHSTDGEWNIQASQMMPNWPKTLLTTVHFIAEGTGSKLRLEQTPVDATTAEIACFGEMMGKMDSGWGKGFDMFDTLLQSTANKD